VARGWESKSVEEQQSEAGTPSDPARPRLTPEQIAHRQRKQGLLLSRKRVEQQLQSAQHPQHREMLEAALSDLEARLRQLD
jgi:hypothetical protein